MTNSQRTLKLRLQCFDFIPFEASPKKLRSKSDIRSKSRKSRTFEAIIVVETMKKNAVVNYVEDSTEVTITCREIALLSMLSRR